MTGKRFKIVNMFDGATFLDNQKDGLKLSFNEVVDCLNNLHEENIQLKGEVAHYKLLLMSLEEEAKRLSQIR